MNIINFPGSEKRNESGAKQSMYCVLTANTDVTEGIFRLEFEWPGTTPRAGQFFMVKADRSSVFLARPLSVAGRKPMTTVQFLVAMRGKGTAELSSMQPGEWAELIGPLGNAWDDFIHPAADKDVKPIALIGGGAGIAPLQALYAEYPECHFDFYAGFRTGFDSAEERDAFLGPALNAPSLIIASDDGTEGLNGRIPDFLRPENYSAVCACGPQPMLKAVAAKCRDARVPCFVSMERRMACGVGACLGCTVKTINGNRRCCADGPIFPAEDVYFD